MTHLRPFWPQVIIDRACEIHGITRQEMLGPRRYARLARPRFAAAYAMRYFGMSYPRIAHNLARRDHSTMIHAYRQAEVYCRHEHGFADIIEELIDAACPGASASLTLPRPTEMTYTGRLVA